MSHVFRKCWTSLNMFLTLETEQKVVQDHRVGCWLVVELQVDCTSCPSPCLCPQQIDNLIHSNLADIVVELLMTLYEGGGSDGDQGDLKRFIG